MFIAGKTKGPRAATRMLPLGNKEPINGSVSIVMSLSSLVNPPGNQTNPEPQPQRSRPDPGAKRHTSGSPRIIRRDEHDERNLRSTRPPVRKPRRGDTWNRASCHKSAHTNTIHTYGATQLGAEHAPPVAASYLPTWTVNAPIISSPTSTIQS